MKLIKGLIDYSTADVMVLKLCTANAEITGNGLVMGAGNALAMKNAYPTTPRVFASLINYRREYGIVCDEINGHWVGAFQTKYHWKGNSPLSLIATSTECLMEIAHEFNEIHLPFPGINHGKADKYEVLDIIYQLPDNVCVYF